MRSKFLIDFDGTIVDVWMRYHKIFADLWGEIDFERYRNAKLQFPDDMELTTFLGLYEFERFEEYKRIKRICLEDAKYLMFDKLLANPKKLQVLFEKEDASVLTVRRNTEIFYTMLDVLGLSFLKNRSIVLKPNGTEVKLTWVSQNMNNTPIIMVGDSEMDLAVGKLPNSCIYLVKTGLRSLSHLKQKNIPFTEIDSINEFLELY